VLIKDDREAFENGWMIFIRIATTFITRAPSTGEGHLIDAACTTYRGSKMTAVQVQSLFVGEVIRAPMFVATSFDPATARTFARNAKYLLSVDIPAHCCNACCIQVLSEYTEEEEVLIPPYSPFHVLDVDHNTRTIRLKLLDGGEYAAREKLPGATHALAKPL